MIVGHIKNDKKLDRKPDRRAQQDRDGDKAATTRHLMHTWTAISHSRPFRHCRQGQSRPMSPIFHGAGLSSSTAQPVARVMLGSPTKLKTPPTAPISVPSSSASTAPSDDGAPSVSTSSSAASYTKAASSKPVAAVSTHGSKKRRSGATNGSATKTKRPAGTRPQPQPQRSPTSSAKTVSMGGEEASRL